MSRAVDVRLPLDLFAHVVGRADRQSCSLRHLIVVRLARHAQVGELRHAVGRQDDVGRLDVAVDQPAIVGVRQRLRI
jgi:hypothetical protein